MIIDASKEFLGAARERWESGAGAGAGAVLGGPRCGSGAGPGGGAVLGGPRCGSGFSGAPVRERCGARWESGAGPGAGPGGRAVLGGPVRERFRGRQRSGVSLEHA